ncbi:hypothetical protein DPMN_063037 [Dreissena polymorpha]|uniref:Uncharacterized protein n=1 Tax=Dreissena polymorpha TaxID=45954 RepID=A0A9D4C9R9_DREPO|nr:hypothetical protein DPMN_063037 [Dreissena polymorpha]
MDTKTSLAPSDDIKLAPTSYKETLETLQESERKFRKACTQIQILNNQLEDIKTRYKKAKTDGFHRFRYNLRLKLAVVEGVRNMYYEYAHAKAEQVALLRHRLYGEIVIVDSGN